nr:glycoside hydrolase family 2 TIM barrel-domain containing protein [Candidatus Sigynarchaeum springense]
MLEQIRLSSSSWWLVPDPRRLGDATEKWFSREWFDAHGPNLASVAVPSSWQTIKGLERYEGVCWYFTMIQREFLERLLLKNNFVSLRFNGVNYLSRAWLNGVELGAHEGGFTPFSFHLSRSTIEQAVGASSGDAILAVRVDNTRRHDQLPEFASDWFQWGGIYRDVFIDVQPCPRVDRCLIAPALSFDSDGLFESAAIKMTIRASAGLAFKWRVAGPDGKIVASGEATMPGNDPGTIATAPQLLVRRFTAAIPDAKLWSPEAPVLYALELIDSKGDLLYTSRFGLREVKASGTDILLNGKRILLRGSSLHEEKFPHGREYPKAERIKDIVAMKALGFNFLRTAHYSHDESLIEAADELGMLVGEEIPVYWNVDFKNPKVLRLAARMARDLIHRDFNHPSVIWWSAGNEVPVSRRDCSQFMVTIMRLAKRLDPTRFSAFVTKAFVYDPARAHSDLLLLNSYFGWYYLTERMFGIVCDVVHGTAPRKPFLMSEFGANAELGFGRREPLDVKSSEWKQASIVSHAIKTFNARPYMCGWVIWIYRDFKSHMRLGPHEQGYNRKGLVDEHDRKKLLATWMPRLVHQRYQFRTWRIYLGMFIAKIAFLPAAFAGVVIDIVSPRVMHKVNTGYYTSEPRHG